MTRCLTRKVAVHPQVYRGKLRPEYGSGEVAVKVQRPGVLEAAALDIFLLRRAAGLLAKIPGMSDQWALTLDDWALRFFQVRAGVCLCVCELAGRLACGLWPLMSRNPLDQAPFPSSVAVARASDNPCPH